MDIFPRAGIEVLESRIAPAAAFLDLSTLNGRNGFALNGAAVGDYSGYSVSSAGDVNGDGFTDIIIGAGAATSGAGKSGSSYVIFGRATGFPSRVELSSLDGTAGFQISGVGQDDYSGASVSSAGDVNGDGFDDLIVGADGADANGIDSGAAYVIFGKASGFTNLSLATLDGTNGFKLSGAGANYATGFSVSKAGDINGDNFDDILVGAFNARPNGMGSGASYVVFGKATGFAANLNLATLDGSNGFRILGAVTGDYLGGSVSDAGDINGDGFDDLIVGADNADPNGSQSGAAYVVFGKASGFAASLNVTALDGTNGFKLSGAAEREFTGISVSAAGDVNGDGFADIVIGADSVITGGVQTGAAYVVFGKAGAFTANLELSSLDGTSGFRLLGAGNKAYTGSSVNNAGDFNGDGFGDIIIGAYGASPHGPDSGVSYLVFGKAGGFSSTVNLAKLDGVDGMKINGEKSSDYAGASVSGAGDVNGDGYDDLIIGASGADPNGSYSGTSYVVFGFDTDILTSRDGKTLTLTDVDGDVIRIKTSKGVLVPQDLVIGPDGSIRTLNISGDQRFTGTNIIVSAKAKNGGNGLVNLELLDATNVDLGKVTVSGQLGRILAGDGDPLKPALKSLTVGSLGTTENIIEPLLSEIDGSLLKLKVKRDVVGAAVDVLGSLGNASIGGDLVGQLDAGGVLLASILERGFADPRVAGGLPFGALNAESVGRFTVAGNVDGGSVTSAGDIGSATIRQDLHAGGVTAGGRIKNVKVLGAMNGDDPDHPSVIAALAKGGSTKPADAVGIDALLVKGDVVNAQILLGFRKNPDDFSLPLLPANPDASAGKVLVKGDWSASSLVAGVFDATGDGFGRNDTTIPGDTSTDIFARIASVVIKGTATGSAAPGDQYAITAQQIGKLSINGEKIALDKDAKDVVPLDPVNGDFSLVEV